MPKGGGGRSGGFSRGSRGFKSSNPPKSGIVSSSNDDRKKNVPAPVQAAPQGGMLREMGVIAGGIAGGHLIADGISNLIHGSHSGGGQPQVQHQQPVYQEREADNPCAIQMKQFLECAQSQQDMYFCQGLNEALKECRITYGLSRY